MQILEQVLNQAAGTDNDLFVVNWSWIDRYDYIDQTTDHWQQNMVPPKTSWKTIMPVDTTNLAQTYYKELHSQYQDKLTTLIYIKTAIDILKQRECRFVMTYIDDLIFETEWEPNPAISDLQKYIKPYMTQFENKTFLEWSNHRGFEISPSLHPLEEAHQNASKYIMRQVFDKQNINDR